MMRKERGLSLAEFCRFLVPFLGIYVSGNCSTDFATQEDRNF